ncbi:g7893 [Coccomyxa elongata]
MIPSLFNDLAEKVQVYQSSEAGAPIEPKKLRIPGGQRKVLKFVDKVTELTSALSFNIFEMQPCTNLYFVLGPSPLRPLETYVLSCSAIAHAVAEADDRATAVARDVSRKVLRSLIINTAAVPEGNVSTGSTKLFLLLQAPRQDEPPSGFLPKRAFQLRQRRGLQVQIQLNTPQQGSPADMKVNATASAPIEMDHSNEGYSKAMTTEDLMWYQCTTSLKGLTISSSQQSGIDGFM